MDTMSFSQQSLINTRNRVLESIKVFFQDKAIEAHVFGSIARGTDDAYSDLDVWLTFENEKITKVLDNRFKYFSKFGNVIHVCEPPQNSPLNGIHSFVLYKTDAGLLHIDFYLCPLSTSFKIEGSKNILGNIKLPTGELSFNPKKTSVPNSYRIDFFILFIFIAIKRLARKKPGALDLLFVEYDNLKNRYQINVGALNKTEQTFTCWRKIIAEVNKFADEKQKGVLTEISVFAKQVEETT